MAESQPIYASCDGGLVLNSNLFELLNSPGIATRLRNFEVALEGGYRRIKGYHRYADASGTQPTGTAANILGIHPYALGLVVCAGTGVYYTEDGITWLQVNRDTTDAGVESTDLAAQTELPRSSQGKAQFVVVRGTVDYATNPYGVLYIATDGGDKISHFRITGTGSSRTFTYKELSTPAAGQWIESHSKHLCVVDPANAPNTIYYSATNDFDDFVGTGSGSIVLPGAIKGIKSFRSDLYVFCQNSIHRLVEINDANNISIIPVTGNLGCVDGYTIQEIGGDLIFLAPDGLRTIAATERISDVELGSLSRPIQPLVNDVVENNSLYTFSSAVLRKKNQYRLFYIDTGGNAYGFAGTLRTTPNGAVGFQWSELRDIPVYSISSYFDSDGAEVVYHGGDDGYVYLHDDGNTFDGDPISSEFETPYIHLGDLGARKTLNYINVAITNEGSNDIVLRANFDFDGSSTTQPDPVTIEISNTVALYGSSLYGTAEYGSLLEQIKRVSMQGSGHTLKLRFTTNDTSSPYTIHGFHIESIPSGRK